ncbi:unnamed protein product [Rotaria sp. Silwood1]|nr:unnamed protein product [Rotaria sp. Silwood1]
MPKKFIYSITKSNALHSKLLFYLVVLIKMAQSSLPDDPSRRNSDNSHLEIFSLIWLDSNVNGSDIRNTEQQLRTIINYVKKFQDVEQCERYIVEQSENDRLVVIVSGRLGRIIVPSIHALRQVVSIYVYCMDKKGNKEWADKFSKVKAVASELTELVTQIKEDHKVQKQAEEPFSINIFNKNRGKGKSTSGLNGKFVFSQMLIECLLRLKSTETDTNEVIKCCKQQYEGNSVELNLIRKFEKTYSPDKALTWYTEESFFYNTLNAVLRNENTYMICLFRTYISDIYHQLKNNQVKERIRVYRGQKISSEELETLKQLIGSFISVNSFFSTSKSYQEALTFVQGSNIAAGLERVVFEIDADPSIITTKPFADISKYSAYNKESEVLFMLGSIFRLNGVECSMTDRLWTIRMSLCSEIEYDLKDVLTHMRSQLGNGDTNLRILGKVLWTMGKIGLAEQYFTRYLKELPLNDPLLSTVYEELGNLLSQKGDYEQSVFWHQKAIDFKNQGPTIIGTTDINKRSEQILILEN